MTRNTISYLELQEKKRSNLQNEAIKKGELENSIRKVKNDWLLGMRENDLKKLANDQLNTRELQKLAETVRSNLVKEQETFRSNTADEAERYRHNLASEYIAKIDQQLKQDLTDKNNATQLKSSLINLGGAIARGLGASLLGYAFGKNSKDGGPKTGSSYSKGNSSYKRAAGLTKGFTIKELLDNAQMANELAMLTAGVGVATSIAEPAMVFGFSGSQREGKASQVKNSVRRNGRLPRRQSYRYGVEDEQGVVNYNEIPRDTSNSRGPGHNNRGGSYENFSQQKQKVEVLRSADRSARSSADDIDQSVRGGGTESNVIYSGQAGRDRETGPGVGIAFS